MKQFSLSKLPILLVLVLSMMLGCVAIIVTASDGEALPQAWDGNVATSFTSGTGTAEDPYVITTPAQLAYMAKLVNSATEFIQVGDTKVYSDNYVLHTFTANTKNAPLGNWYYVEYGEDGYLYSCETGVAYPASAYQAVTYKRWTIGGVDYYALSSPQAGQHVDAYTYNADTNTMEKCAEQLTYNASKHWFFESNYDAESAGTYSTKAYDHSARNITYTKPDGNTGVMTFDLYNSTYYAEVLKTLSTITINEQFYGWISEKGQLSHHPVTVVSSDDNGIMEISLEGNPIVMTGSYAEAYYKLGADIALNDTKTVADWANSAPKNSWAPIGTNVVTPFMGDFDGAGHTIYGLYIKGADATLEYAGLFGYTNDATIHNFTLDKGYIFSLITAGGVAAYMKGGIIHDVKNAGVTVSAEKGFTKHTTLCAIAGGIVADMSDGAEVRSCENNATVRGTNMSNSSGSGQLDAYAGGIVGRAVGTKTLEVAVMGSRNTGFVYSQTGHDYRTSRAGGIVGQLTYGMVSGSFNSALIENDSNGYLAAGGIAAALDNSSAVACVNTGEIKHNKISNRGVNSEGVGGIVGYTTTAGVIQGCVHTGIVTTARSTDSAYSAGLIVGRTTNAKMYIHYNYYVPAAADAQIQVVVGTNSSNIQNVENYPITAAHLAGTATDVISAEGTYANTADIVLAINQTVKALNRNHTFTLNRDGANIVAYKPYSQRFNATFASSQYGFATPVSALEALFPYGIETEGAAVGENFRFRVTANDGYVIRSVTYKYGKSGDITIFPDSDSVYSFEMPDAAVTVTMNFVATGADVYSITYRECDEVISWSAYAYTAHFKGYATSIPVPTRSGYHFKGWLVNDSTTPVMNLTLGANDYSANITLTATWEAKFMVDLDLHQQTPTYNGSKHEFAVLGNSASLSGIEVTYFVDGKWTKVAPTNAGAYQVRLTRAEDANYQKYDITLTEGLYIQLAPSSIVINNDVSKIYNNAPVVNPEVTTVGDGTVSYTWAKADGTPLTEAPKDAGRYIVKAIISQGVNYAKAEVTAEVVITRAAIDMSLVEWDYKAPFTYGNTEYVVSVVGLPSDVVITYAGVHQAKDAGTYTTTVTLTVDENNYFPVTFEGLTWTINPATLNEEQLSWAGGNFVYDGTEKVVSIAGLPSDVSVLAYTNNSATLAGNYTASVTFSYDTNNYSSVSIAPLAWTIAKATYDMSNVSWTTSEFTYDGTEKSISLTGIPEGLSVVYENNAFKGAGTYTVKASFTGDVNYNTVAPMTLTWTVKKAETIITVERETVLVYNGQVQTIPATLNHSETTIIFNPEVLKEEGKYTVLLTAPETANYAKAEVIITVKIQADDAELLRRFAQYVDEAYATENVYVRFLNLNAAYAAYNDMDNKSLEGTQDVVNRYGYVIALYNAQIKGVNHTMAQAEEVALTVSQTYVPSVAAVCMLSDIKKKYDE